MLLPQDMRAEATLRTDSSGSSNFPGAGCAVPWQGTPTLPYPTQTRKRTRAPRAPLLAQLAHELAAAHDVDEPRAVPARHLDQLAPEHAVGGVAEQELARGHLEVLQELRARPGRPLSRTPMHAAGMAARRAQT